LVVVHKEADNISEAFYLVSFFFQEHQVKVVWHSKGDDRHVFLRSVNNLASTKFNVDGVDFHFMREDVVISLLFEKNIRRNLILTS